MGHLYSARAHANPEHGRPPLPTAALAGFGGIQPQPLARTDAALEEQFGLGHCEAGGLPGAVDVLKSPRCHLNCRDGAMSLRRHLELVGNVARLVDEPHPVGD